MMSRRSVVGLLLLLGCLAAWGKNKKKVVLPFDVLQAQSVLVVIDPNAGEPIDAPLANRNARNDVERALRNWGRFRMAMNESDADLIVTVCKGSGKIAHPTIGGIPDDRPVINQPPGTGPGIGGPRGNPTPGYPGANSPPAPQPQVTMGDSEDMFLVYRGKRDHPLDSSPVWRYIAKDGLRSPGVPAVDEFRKAIVEAEKQQANNP